MHFEEEKHNFTFRFDSNDGEVQLEMNCNELYLTDILDRFAEFLRGCGYVIDGELEVVSFEKEETYQSKQDKFSMDHLPNNGWPFGSLKTESISTLTTADIQAIKPIDLSQINQYPTMAPLTSEQVYSWSADLPTQNGEKVRVRF